MQLRDNPYGELCRDGLFAKSVSPVFFQLNPLRLFKRSPIKWSCTRPKGMYNPKSISNNVTYKNAL
jgi:hypothetical protein